MSRDWVSPVDAERLYKKQQRVVKSRVTATRSYNPCSCVSYARYIRGVDVGSIGVARNHPVNAQVPTVGAYVVTYESWAGHLGVVTGVTDTHIIISEANYVRCTVTKGRMLPIDSPLIKGYYL